MKSGGTRKSSVRRTYSRQLIVCFAAAFAVFAFMLVVFQMRLDTRTKIRYVENDLDSYAGILAKTGDYEHVAALFPEDLRATVLDTAGNVLFDSIRNLNLENHADRPEITGSLRDSVATAVRVSMTTGTKYLYYSKTYGDRIIRVALPYDADVEPLIRPSNIFPLASAFLFAIALLVIVLLSTHFGDDVQRLQSRYVEDSDKAVANLKQQLTGNVSHELRTPVTSIMGCLETLESCPDMDPERRRNFIHRARVQAVRLSDLIRDMSLISKIEESPEKLVRQNVNLREIADEVCAGFSERIAEKGDTLENLLPDDLTVCGNRTLLHAIFRNLVENSLKYAGDGVKLRIECQDGQRGDILHLSYCDTGCGVPPEHLPRLFERFYRISEGRSRDDGGSGLGLSIVRNAVAFHGGEIRAVNREPHGLQFFFTLRRS